jgi:hypothetical protein
MAMIKGITIIIPKKIEVGTDEFKRPIYEYDIENGEKIQNVLVAPTLSDDLTSTVDLTGKKAVYTMAIPKGDAHDWEECVVYFFGCLWKSFGYPIEGIEENIPLDWNKKVTVERYG